MRCPNGTTETAKSTRSTPGRRGTQAPEPAPGEGPASSRGRYDHRVKGRLHKLQEARTLQSSRHDPTTSETGDVVRHYLGDIVYGALDGLVTTFAIVSAAVGAHRSALVIVVLGGASLIADAFSMGAANYLAIRSDASAHGIDRGLSEPLRHALFTFVSFVALGAVPLIAYMLPLSPGNSYLASGGLTAVSLFGVGALRATVSEVKWLRGGIEILAIGALAALVAYGAGNFLERLVAG